MSVNKAIRNIHRGEHNTITKYKKLRILTVSQIYDLRLGEFMYKYLTLNERQLHFNITDEITLKHNYNTRNHDKFIPPPIQTETNRRFFIYNAVILWPNIPDNIKNSSSLYSFRSQFKSQYFKID